MRRHLSFLLWLVLFLLGNSSFAQPACPSVAINPGNVSICGGCTSLTATIQGTVTTDTYSVSPITYTPFAYSGGTAVLVNDDDLWSNPITLPFCFQYFGKTYTQALIGANGQLTFDLSQTTCNAPFNPGYDPWEITSAIPFLGGCPFSGSYPQDAPGNTICAAFRDIDPTFGGDIAYYVTGTAPCRSLVVYWSDIELYGACSSEPHSTFQLVLSENTNYIDVYIKNSVSCNSWNNGYGIIGIQNQNATVGLSPPNRNFPDTWTANNEAWRFTPTGTPQYNLTWYAPPNTVIGTAATVSVCPTTTTTYTATVVNNTCNGPITVSAFSTVTLGAGMPVVMSSTPTACGNNAGTAKATPGGGVPPYTYLWSPSGQNTQTATGLAAGPYSVLITDNAGCGVTQTVTVASTGGFTYSVTSTPTACSNNSGTATASPVGGAAPYTYLWTPSSQNTQTATGLGAGNYSVSVTDNSGCASTQTVDVSSIGGFTVTTTSAPTMCAGSIGTATVTPAGGAAPFTYNWTPSGQNTQTATGLGSGTYTVMVTDNLGCIETETVAVASIGGLTPTAAPTASITCFGGSNGSATATPASGSAPYSYLWNNGQTNQLATGLSSGNYSVTVTDVNGCLGTATTSLVDPTPLTATSSVATDTCGKKVGSATINSVVGTNPYTYLWIVSPVQTNATVTGLSSGSYTCLVTDANGCTGLAGLIIGNIPGPRAEFTPSPQVVSILDGEINFLDGSTPDVANWIWDFGDTSGFSSLQNPAYLYEKEGTYVVTLIVTNTSGCPDTVQHIVQVEGYSTFYVPNTFTPNHDGRNDFFGPVFTRIDNDGFSMEIFDRWGNLVFESKSPKEYWDGKVKKNGNIVQEDVYVYTITYQDIKHVQHKLIGNVNVVK